MARIVLSDYSIIDVGRKIFFVESVEYNEDFGKLKVNLITNDGQKHSERFSLFNNKGEVNNKALGAFTFFAKNVLNDFDVQDIDEQDLVGHYFAATVTHDEVPSAKDPNKINTYARLGNYGPAKDFDDQNALIEEDVVEETPVKTEKVAPQKPVVKPTPKPAPKPEVKPTSASVVDLSILDD